MEEIASNFTLDRITKSAAVFDREKLEWMSGVYMRQLSTGDLAGRMLPFLERDLPQDSLPVERPYLERIVPLVQERVKLLSDADEWTSYFFNDVPEYDPKTLVQRNMDAQSTLGALRKARDEVTSAESFDHESLEALLRAVGAELGLSGPAVFWRIAHRRHRAYRSAPVVRDDGGAGPGPGGAAAGIGRGAAGPSFPNRGV